VADGDSLAHGRITDDAIALMRKRIGYPNQTVRSGVIKEPWNVYATQDAFRRWAISIGDANPLYCDPDYPKRTRWQAAMAPPGFEMSMGIDSSPVTPPDLDRETRPALRGVHLYHSGGETYYYGPIREGTRLFCSKTIAGVEEKVSRFAGRSVVITNDQKYWDDDSQVLVRGVEWFVHAERRKVGTEPRSADKSPGVGAEIPAPTRYTEEQLAEIDAAYESEYLRGTDTLFFEDVKVGMTLPRMVKGPLTVTDMINAYMGAGWLVYGSWPYRLAYLNRKSMPRFYTRNEFNSWDTLQRLHWDPSLARDVGVPGTYDIGPMRKSMLCHYCSNYAGDDGWVYRVKYEFRQFNFMGDTTWINGTITEARIDPTLGPLIELEVSGVNQRGKENLRASATILVASRATGPVSMPALARHR
jgi:acyl dehydratase